MTAFALGSVIAFALLLVHGLSVQAGRWFHQAPDTTTHILRSCFYLGLGAAVWVIAAQICDYLEIKWQNAIWLPIFCMAVAVIVLLLDAYFFAPLLNRVRPKIQRNPSSVIRIHREP